MSLYHVSLSTANLAGFTELLHESSREMFIFSHPLLVCKYFFAENNVQAVTNSCLHLEFPTAEGFMWKEVVCFMWTQLSLFSLGGWVSLVWVVLLCRAVWGLPDLLPGFNLGVFAALPPVPVQWLQLSGQDVLQPGGYGTAAEWSLDVLWQGAQVWAALSMDN